MHCRQLRLCHRFENPSLLIFEFSIASCTVNGYAAKFEVHDFLRSIVPESYVDLEAYNLYYRYLFYPVFPLQVPYCEYSGAEFASTEGELLIYTPQELIVDLIVFIFFMLS
jgi:hypothetical protein